MSLFRHAVAEAKPTLALAFPMMAGQLSQMLMGVVDNVMVGQLGVVPLAASAFANSLFGVPFLVGIGLLQSVAVRASQAHGSGERAEAAEVLRHGLALAFGAGALLAAVTVLAGMRLSWFGQPPEVAAEARPFLLLIGVSLIPMLGTLSLRQFSEALAHPWPPMMLMFGGVVLNAALNWFLIYGHGGAPALGLAGAGWATLIARIAVLLALLLYTLRAKRFAEVLPSVWLGALHWRRVRSLLAIGAPAAGQLLLEVSAFSLAAIMVGWLGGVPLAAHQIALTCAATSFMFPLGVAMAATIRIGQAMGAAATERLRAIGLSALGLGALFTGLGGALLWFGSSRIARWFVADEAVARQAESLLHIAALFQLFDGAQVVAAGALRGLNDTRTPMGICLVAYWCVAIPFGYATAFPGGWGAEGVWTGLAVALAIAALLLCRRFFWLTGEGRLGGAMMQKTAN